MLNTKITYIELNHAVNFIYQTSVWLNVFLSVTLNFMQQNRRFILKQIYNLVI